MYTFSLLLTSLLYSASSITVYHVVPDNQFSSSNNNTYTLDHYLNNVNKYFTSDTELHFLAGHYNLNTIIFVTSVTNFSIIGEIVNGIISVNISCGSFPSGVVITQSSNLKITGINLMECSTDVNAYSNYSEYMRLDLQLQRSYGLLIIDVMGECILSEVSICSLFIACTAEQDHVHISTETKVVLVIQKITWLEPKRKNSYKIALLLNHSLAMNVIIRDIYFRNIAAIYVQNNTCIGKNSMQVISCHFLHITNIAGKISHFRYLGVIFMKVNSTCHHHNTEYWKYKLLINNCSFVANSIRGHLLYLYTNITTSAFVMLDQCIFHNNSVSYQLTVKSKGAENVTFVIKDTVFSHLHHLPYALNTHSCNPG